MLNRARERRHPCQTPKEVWKKSSHMMLRRTALFESCKVEVLHDLPQAFVPDTVKCFLEVDEVMVEVILVLQMFLYQQSYVEDLFCCASLWSKSCLFFC